MARTQFDVWICEGKVCSSRDSDGLSDCAKDWGSSSNPLNNISILRGGCYGLCDLGVNVVVRRWVDGEEKGDREADRLSLTHRDNETVYSEIKPHELTLILDTHANEDRPVPHMTYEVREELSKPASETLARIRALRQKRKSLPKK